MPQWKQDFVRKNRLLYSENKDFIDSWLERWKVLDMDDEANLSFQLVEPNMNGKQVQIVEQIGKIYSNLGHPELE